MARLNPLFCTSIGLLLTLFGSCKMDGNSRGIDQTFLEKDSAGIALRKVPYFVTDDRSGWEVGFVGAFESSDSLTIRLSKTESDTAKNVIFSVDRNLNPLAVLRYFKEYGVKDRNYLVLLGPADTLYAFYTVENSEEKHFLVGQYCYRSVHLGFDTGEEAFYFMHKDSLDKVRGSNLPKLPSLTSPSSPLSSH